LSYGWRELWPQADVSLRFGALPCPSENMEPCPSENMEPRVILQHLLFFPDVEKM
jgi:hypothetical protein